VLKCVGSYFLFRAFITLSSYCLIVPLLLLLHDSLVFLILLSSTLFLAVVVYAIYLLLSQCCCDNSIYFPVFLGTIHYTNYWRSVGSLLSSTFFCQLLWHFCYPLLFFLSLPTIFGYMAPFSTYEAYPISSSSSINIYCIGVPC